MFARAVMHPLEMNSLTEVAAAKLRTSVSSKSSSII